MRPTVTRTSISALSLALVLALTGCGDNDSDETAPDTPGGTPTEITGDDQADDQADDQDSTDTGTAPDDVTQAALQAIATAEAEVGGTAYEIDDEDDDQAWEVDVAVDDRGVEVKVSADGTTVTGTEDDDDFDDDERAGLEQAQVSITEAIETAIAEVGGTLDDAELEEDDGRIAWEVTVDTADDDDIEVYIDITSGEVLGIDR